MVGGPIMLRDVLWVRHRWPIIAFVSAATFATLAALWALAAPATQDRLLYNHTPSVPVGFYLRTERPLERGAFVTVRARDVAPRAAAIRNFGELRHRFIKRVAALAGDNVCADGESLRVNESDSYVQLAHDSNGAPLDPWQECRVLRSDEILLLGDTDQSFDGRYWGPITVSMIEGVWRPL